MRKAQLILILASPFLFFACASNLYFDMTLTGVEIPVDAKKQYGRQRIIRFKDEGKSKINFEDENIKVIWNPTLFRKFEFALTNKTEHSIKILWDESVYVDEKGKSKRVFHSQPFSIVARGSTIFDSVDPDNIDTRPVSFGEKEMSLFPIYPIHPNTSVTKKEKIRRAKLLIGQTVQVLLSIEIEGTVNEHIFLFEITDAKYLP